MRFTIRDLFRVTVVVAILAAFYAETYRLAGKAREVERQAVSAAKAALEKVKARVKDAEQPIE